MISTCTMIAQCTCTMISTCTMIAQCTCTMISTMISTMYMYNDKYMYNDSTMCTCTMISTMIAQCTCTMISTMISTMYMYNDKYNDSTMYRVFVKPGLWTGLDWTGLGSTIIFATSLIGVAGGSPDSCIQLLYCTDRDPTNTKLTLGCTTKGPYFLGFTFLLDLFPGFYVKRVSTNTRSSSLDNHHPPSLYTYTPIHVVSVKLIDSYYKLSSPVQSSPVQSPGFTNTPMYMYNDKYNDSTMYMYNDKYNDKYNVHVQ